MKTLYEDAKLKAELDGVEIVLTYKAVGKSARVSATVTPKPVTDSDTIAQLKRAGIDPATRRMLGQAACMPAEIAEQIIEAAREDAEVKFRLLSEERQRLAGDLAALIDLEHQAHERAVEIGSATGVIPAVKDYTAEIEAAREALRRFDADHPEVKARLDAERTKRVEEHMWD